MMERTRWILLTNHLPSYERLDMRRNGGNRSTTSLLGIKKPHY
jgi:hypothetical protein